MRTIDRSSVFKRDYKREAKGQHRKTLDQELIPILKALVKDEPLAARHRDHDLRCWEHPRHLQHICSKLLFFTLGTTNF